MRFLIGLVLVGAAAAGGWYWVRHRTPAAPEETAPKGEPDGSSLIEDKGDAAKAPAAPKTPEPAPAPSVPAEECLKAAEKALAAKQPDEAAAQLRKALAADPRSPAGKKAAEKLLPLAQAQKDTRWELTCKWRLGQADAALWKRLDELNEPLFGSQPSASPATTVRTVKGGETLGKIARETGSTVEAIRLLNRKRDDRIFADERLKILPLKKHVSIEVSKNLTQLVLLHDGALLKKYDIGIGRDNKTPEGNFKIGVRLEDPPWYKERGKPPIPHGDPENILGTRWMGFEAPFTDFAIHGTTKPETIGKKLSDGCVRMRNAEVEELYALTPSGTPVFISP